MPSYKCKNEDCSKFDELVSFDRARITIVNSTALDRNDYCEECKQKRELIRKPGITSTVLGTNDQMNRNKRNGDPLK